MIYILLVASIAAVFWAINELDQKLQDIVDNMEPEITDLKADVIEVVDEVKKV